MVDYKLLAQWTTFVLCLGVGVVMQIQAATYRGNKSGSYNFLFSFDGFQAIIAFNFIQMVFANGFAFIVITKKSFSWFTSGPFAVAMAIGTNFMASIGLLNNSILLANLCTKLNSSGSTVCDNSEKSVITFVCLSCGFLMLQEQHRGTEAVMAHLLSSLLAALGLP